MAGQERVVLHGRQPSVACRLGHRGPRGPGYRWNDLLRSVLLLSDPDGSHALLSQVWQQPATDLVVPLRLLLGHEPLVLRAPRLPRLLVVHQGPEEVDPGEPTEGYPWHIRYVPDRRNCPALALDNHRHLRALHCDFKVRGERKDAPVGQELQVLMVDSFLRPPGVPRPLRSRPMFELQRSPPEAQQGVKAAGMPAPEPE